MSLRRYPALGDEGLKSGMNRLEVTGIHALDRREEILDHHRCHTVAQKSGRHTNGHMALVGFDLAYDAQAFPPLACRSMQLDFELVDAYSDMRAFHASASRAASNGLTVAP